MLILKLIWTLMRKKDHH